MPRLSLLLLLGFAPWLVADEPERSEKPVTPGAIAAWVHELADEDFFVREAATRQLWEAGPDATRGALEAARDGADEEVSYRARKVLWNFDHGILVDTPAEIVQLVEKFRVGNSSMRLSVAKQLGEQGHVRTLTALLRNTLDGASRTKFVAQLGSSVDEALPRLFAEERHDEIRDWLDLAAAGGNSTAIRHRNAFLLMRGELDDRIARLSESLDVNSPPADHAELARMLILSGKLDAAATHAVQSGNLALKRDLAVRRRDWAALAEDDLLPGDSDVERQTFRVVFLRLAGDKTRLDESVAKLTEIPSWPHGEALLLAERYDEALDVFRRNSSAATALELAVARGDHRTAFEAFGIGADAGGAVAWFQREIGDGGVDESRAAIGRGLGVLREITRLRGRRAGRELLEEIRRTAREHPETGQLASLVDVETDLGFREEAFADATEALARLDPEKSPSLLGPLFDDRESTAFVCWQWRRRYVAAEMSGETPAASLEWVADLLGGREIDLPIETVLGALVEIAESQPEAGARRRWRKAASEVAYDRERYDLASDSFAPVLEESQSVVDLLWDADIRAEAGDWNGAAEAYARAAERNGIAAMLQGLALERAGEPKRGREIVDRAHLAMLGDIRDRSAAASELSDRGFDDEARRQWETIIRLGPQGTFEGTDAWAVQLSSARLGNAVSETDPLRAADLWERYLIDFANTNSAYTEARRYLAVSHLVHRTRARGLLSKDRIAEALAEAKRAHDVWPGNIEVALQLVPPLDERGREADADAVFALVHDVAAKRAEDFPDNAGGHNDLAWLNAKCGRRLDEAVVHARKAVEMEPKSAAYLDTLAEVHFQRGERAQAIEFAQKCLALDPRGEHYREQLERFRGE